MYSKNEAYEMHGCERFCTQWDLRLNKCMYRDYSLHDYEVKGCPVPEETHKKWIDIAKNPEKKKRKN